MLRPAGFKRLTYSASAVAATIDGNSLVAGSLASGPSFYLSAQVAALAPISGQFSITNRGIGSQTIRQMNGLDGGSATDVDGSYVAGKTNILIVWEGTNSIQSAGRTGLQAASDMADYCSARLAANPWRIIILTALPRYESGAALGRTINQVNAEIDTFNAAVRSQWRSMGAVGYCDVRPSGGPFDLPDYTLASFERAQTIGLWGADAGGNHVHLNDAGFAYVAQQLALALKRVRA